MRDAEVVADLDRALAATEAVVAGVRGFLGRAV
jgi:hypothetical protein